MKNLACFAVAASIIVGAGSSARGSGDVEHGNVAFAVSPDGRHVAFSAADGHLYLFSIDERRVVLLSKNQETQFAPAFSPDGAAIIYTASVVGRRGPCLFSQTLDGKRNTQLTNEPDVADSMPRYSRDGKQVTFVRAHRLRPYSMGGWTWDNNDVYVMSSDGTNQRRLTRHNYHEAGSPCFIAEGKAILFSASGDYPDMQTYVFTVQTDGTEPPKLLTAPPASQKDCVAWCATPSTSTDGKQIAFISDRSSPFQYDVLTMRADTTETRRLGVTKISRYNHQPVFLPDGKGILFLAATEWNSQQRPIFSLWQVDLDGSPPHRIADSGLFTDPLHWPAPASKTKPGSGVPGATSTDPRGVAEPPV